MYHFWAMAEGPAVVGLGSCYCPRSLGFVLSRTKLPEPILSSARKTGMETGAGAKVQVFVGTQRPDHPPALKLQSANLSPGKTNLDKSAPPCVATPDVKVFPLKFVAQLEYATLVIVY
jgi:hypothetical protein